MNDRFQQSKVVQYLASIPQDAIDDQFNPFSVKDKWTKFFRSGTLRAQVDPERALKNEYSPYLKDFIRDRKHSLTDK